MRETQLRAPDRQRQLQNADCAWSRDVHRDVASGTGQIETLTALPPFFPPPQFLPSSGSQSTHRLNPINMPEDPPKPRSRAGSVAPSMAPSIAGSTAFDSAGPRVYDLIPASSSGTSRAEPLSFEGEPVSYMCPT